MNLQEGFQTAKPAQIYSWVLPHSLCRLPWCRSRHQGGGLCFVFDKIDLSTIVVTTSRTHHALTHTTMLCNAMITIFFSLWRKERMKFICNLVWKNSSFLNLDSSPQSLWKGLTLCCGFSTSVSFVHRGEPPNMATNTWGLGPHAPSTLDRTLISPCNVRRCGCESMSQISPLRRGDRANLSSSPRIRERLCMDTLRT